MHIPYSATGNRRSYNRWVANETMEDFALRFTARRARRFGYGRIANTAIGSISFLALEAIGGTITLTYGFDAALAAILIVGLILMLTGLPICYYAARYGVDIDLLTRGAGFGYIGSTITSLIYASFTFIFFALEASILAFALEFCFGMPVSLGYLVSALVVIPLVLNGFSKISAFHTWTQPLWIALHILPFAILLFQGRFDLQFWTGYGDAPDAAGLNWMSVGFASAIVFSLAAQIGEQVDFLRFLPEPQTRKEQMKWWLTLLASGPGWSVIGVVKMLAGSFLTTYALLQGETLEDSTDPTHMYFVLFDLAFRWEWLAVAVTGIFVVLSQLKINVTNAYAGSIAWSNFFSRLTHSHPGRVIWLVFNVAIAIMLMELGVFAAIGHILGLYSHVAVAWIGAITADLVINKPLGLSPKGIEFRRAHLYDLNPVGVGSMVLAVAFSLIAHSGVIGPWGPAYSSGIALVTALVVSPLIAFVTKGKYYIARPCPEGKAQTEQTCCVCEYSFDPEDMTDCPFYAGPICSLCCTLDSSCRDTCKPEGRLDAMTIGALQNALPARIFDALTSRLSFFLVATSVPAAAFGSLLWIIRSHAGSPDLDAIITLIFCSVLVCIGIIAWTLILARESQHKARDEADLQTQRLLREVRAHERTDAELQRAMEKAEAANLAKTRYMAGISHELRTPLNAIYGYAQILEGDAALPLRRREAARSIRRSSEHLAGLIENLLDISKIEAGRLEISRDRINLRAFLAQVTAIFEGQAKAKALDFRITTRGNIPTWVDCDEKRLRQILINLLSNALRYTEKGRVDMEIAYRNEVATITVTDTGIGIPPDQIHRIWKPFERLSRAGAGGSGLGLTITRLLVEILGGDISVESELGKGSRFTLRLMLPSVRPSVISRMPEAHDARKVHATGYVGPRKAILAVDDDLDHLALLETLLKPMGFLIQCQPSPVTALASLEDIAPDLFILDIDMPEMDGWSLAQRLRDDPKFRSTPIMMVSAHALEARSQVQREGLFDAFIIKPYSLEDLLLRIAELLRVPLLHDTPDHATPPARVADRDTFKKIRDLALLGHAAPLRRLIDTLDDTPNQSGPNLRQMMAEFDMSGILKYAEEVLSHDT
ncbi:MAG: ATP-binding protein [Pseudomonadota bacterium]|nr:ATP-binding protein [Pseudomonadota bacterium]MEE3069726.1 ATP-binding protein [Pseudomonadota bacterium]